MKFKTRIFLIISITIILITSIFILIKNKLTETKFLASTEFYIAKNQYDTQIPIEKIPIDGSKQYELVTLNKDKFNLNKQTYNMVHYETQRNEIKNINVDIVTLQRDNIFAKWKIIYPNYTVLVTDSGFDEMRINARKLSLKDFENMDNATVRKLTSSDDVQAELKNSMDNKLTPEQIQQLQGTAARTTQ